MEYVPVVSREGFVAAALHDLVVVPESPYGILPYVSYVVGSGRQLYIAYYIEKHGLWRDLFLRITGLSGSSREELKQVMLEYVLSELKELDVFMWDRLKDMLSDLSERVGELYENIKDNIIGYIRKVYGFKEFFGKVYVIYGFNPLPRRTYGSMLYYDNDKTIISLYVNDVLKPREVIDLMLHEVLHGLIRLNNIEMQSDIEELVIDLSCPEGYLSKIIGLSDKVKVDYVKERFKEHSRLIELIAEYFEEKEYEKATIFEWLAGK